jgi:nucleotide-binding universal stress UspA family protein
VAGVDVSAGAAQAVAALRSFPLPDETEILLLTIPPTVEYLTRTSRVVPLPLMGTYDADEFIERLRQDTQGRPDPMADSLSEGGHQVVTDIRRGDSAATRLRAAEDQAADLIVVGSQGHSAFGRFVLGSTSERVLRHAHCSVRVARSAIREWNARCRACSTTGGCPSGAVDQAMDRGGGVQDRGRASTHRWPTQSGAPFRRGRSSFP